MLDLCWVWDYTTVSKFAFGVFVQDTLGCKSTSWNHG